MCDKYRNALYIRPRQRGKTTGLLQLFIDTIRENLRTKNVLPFFVVMNQNELDRIKRLLRDGFGIPITDKIMSRVIKGDQIGDIYGIRSYGATYYIDEIDFMPQRIKEKIWKTGIKYVAMTTPRKLYNRKQMESIRFWLKHKTQFRNVLCTEDELDKLYGDNDLVYSPFIDPHTEVFEWEDPDKRRLSPEQYQTEILGQLYE